ncbi:MAG: hypothetical protein Kow00108_10160 [Calditrichia bacterium]
MKKYILIIIILIFILPESIFAIPAFARKYKVSCTTCHAPFPRLKAYGDEFAGNGFIMKENEKDRYYVKTGDEELKLNKDFPLAVRTDLFITHEPDKNVESDLALPWGVKLLSGGTITDHVGYYFYFYLSERGEVAGIEDAYIHFDNVFNTNLDIMIGQFQTSDPMLKRELRLTYEDYLLYTYSPTYQPGDIQSTINLKYDRGIMLVYGLEKTGTDLVAMIVNGNGKGEFINKKADKDKYKNVGFRLSQGLPFDISVGGFYYHGIERLTNLNFRENTVQYIGPDLSFSKNKINLTLQYLRRHDDIIANGSELDTDLFITECVFLPTGENGKHFITGLYNYLSNDFQTFSIGTISYSYLFARNLKLMIEFSNDFENENSRFVAGLTSAF